MAEYIVRKNQAGEVLSIQHENTFIPPTEENKDYRTYLEWVDGGGIPQEIILPE